jgi:hypothetical protein
MRSHQAGSIRYERKITLVLVYSRPSKEKRVAQSAIKGAFRRLRTHHGDDSERQLEKVLLATD